MRHIDTRQSWVEVLRDDSIVKFKWVPTKGTLAEISTELLSTLTFERLQEELMVRKSTPAVPRAAAPDVQVQALKRRQNIGLTQRLRLRGQQEIWRLGAAWGVV